MVGMLLTCPIVFYPTAVPSCLITSSAAETEACTSTTQEISRHVCQLGKMLYFFRVFLYFFFFFFALFCGLGGGGLGVGSEIGFLGLVFSVERLSGFFWGWGSVYIQE